MTYQIKHGFIGDEYRKQYEQIRKNNKLLFDLSSRINNLNHLLFYFMDGKVPTDNLKKILLSTLFIKSMTSFQGIMILSSKGMHKEKNIILRTFLELYFWFMAITRDDDTCKKYILHGELCRIKDIEAIQKHRQSWHEVLGGIKKIEDRIDFCEREFERVLKETNCSRSEIERLHKPYNVAKLSEIDDTYLLIYSLLSNDVHTNSLCLDEYYSMDNYNNITTINYGPRDFDIERSLTAAIRIQIQIDDIMIDVFEMTQYKSDIQDIHDDWIDYKAILKIPENKT